MTTDWHKRFFEMCKLYSTFSKDPSRKIGAIAVDPNKKIVLSAGYNGFPRGILDTPERLNNREVKYRYVVHAEMNVIYNASFSGVSLDGCDIYVYGLPVCSECAKGIIQVGVKRVYILTEMEIPEIWEESFKLTRTMLEEAGIEVWWERKS